MRKTVTVEVEVNEELCYLTCPWLYAACWRCQLFDADLDKSHDTNSFTRCQECLSREING